MIILCENIVEKANKTGKTYLSQAEKGKPIAYSFGREADAGSVS